MGMWSADMIYALFLSSLLCCCSVSVALKTELELLGQNDLWLFDTFTNLDGNVTLCYQAMSSLFKMPKDFTEWGALQRPSIYLFIFFIFLSMLISSFQEGACTKYTKIKLQPSSLPDASNQYNKTPKDLEPYKGRSTVSMLFLSL